MHQPNYLCLSPKYRIAEDVVWTILDEYVKKRSVRELTFREILVHVREIHMPFRASDVAELMAEYLSEKGMKVWR